MDQAVEQTQREAVWDALTYSGQPTTDGVAAILPLVEQVAFREGLTLINNQPAALAERVLQIGLQQRCCLEYAILQAIQEIQPH